MPSMFARSKKQDPPNIDGLGNVNSGDSGKLTQILLSGNKKAIASAKRDVLSFFWTIRYNHKGFTPVVTRLGSCCHSFLLGRDGHSDLYTFLLVTLWFCVMLA